MSGRGSDRQAFHAFVDAHRRFLLTTHINPDGDGLGSEVAMALALGARGKRVAILNDATVPAAFQFLTRLQPIESFEPERLESRLGEADAVIVLDTSSRERIGRVGPALDRHLLPIAIVDHHVSHVRGFGRVNVIEPDASSTGELVWELIREGGGEITASIAEALYVALMTDTGSFRYSNTDSQAHRVAADLLSHGLDPQRLYAQVYSHASAGRLRFFGEVLSRLEMLEGGRIVLLEAAPEQFQRHGLSGADTEGLVDYPRSIAGIDVVALISEVEPGRVKVSLRSTGRVAIDKVVARLGGGGHPHAAGALIHGTRAEVRERLLPELRRVVSEPAPASVERA